MVCSIRTLIQVLTAPPQLAIDTPDKAAEHAPSAWVSATTSETRMEHQAPSFSMAQDTGAASSVAKQ